MHDLRDGLSQTQIAAKLGVKKVNIDHYRVIGLAHKRLRY